jgi:hypothetical protein
VFFRIKEAQRFCSLGYGAESYSSLAAEEKIRFIIGRTTILKYRKAKKRAAAHTINFGIITREKHSTGAIGLKTHFSRRMITTKINTHPPQRSII